MITSLKSERYPTYSICQDEKNNPSQLRFTSQLIIKIKLIKKILKTHPLSTSA